MNCVSTIPASFSTSRASGVTVTTAPPPAAPFRSGSRTAPPSAASGGRLQHRGDDSEVPDLLVVSYEFDEFVLTLEHSNYPRYMRKTESTIRRNDELPYWTQNATRIELYGSERHMTVGRHGGGWQVTEAGGRVHEQMYGRFPDPEHQADFVDAVKTGRRPNADIEEGHLSTLLPQYANISYRLGGEKLIVDPKTERFTNSEAGNALLRREEYRKPWVISDPV